MNRQEEYCLEEGEEVGDGRAEILSAIRDGGKAAISLMPDVDGTHIHIFESLQLEGLYVRELLYLKLNNYFVLNTMLSCLLGTSQSTHWAYDKGKRKKFNQIALPSAPHI